MMLTKSKHTSGQVLTRCSKKHLKAVALRTYSGHRKQSVENERIVELLPMVHSIAQRVTTYLKPPLSFGDLVSAGTIGLVKAARDFDPSCRAEFKTYAYIRIKGAILDELRGWSFVSVNLHRQIRKAAQFSREIAGRTGAAPTDDELAEKLGKLLVHSLRFGNQKNFSRPDRRYYFVNLISFNPSGHTKFKPSQGWKIKKFKEILQILGVDANQRYRFGKEIKAACGQLAAEG